VCVEYACVLMGSRYGNSLLASIIQSHFHKYLCCSNQFFHFNNRNIHKEMTEKKKILVEECTILSEENTKILIAACNR